MVPYLQGFTGAEHLPMDVNVSHFKCTPIYALHSTACCLEMFADDFYPSVNNGVLCVGYLSNFAYFN